MMLSIYVIRASGQRSDFNCDDEHIIATQNSGDFAMDYVKNQLMLAGFEDVKIKLVSNKLGKFIPEVKGS